MICINSVKVSPSEISILKCDWYYNLRAEITPANASCCEVVWSSSNTSIVTVNATTGYVHAKKAGTARIYATATDGSGKVGSCLVTVIEIPVESVSLCPCKKTLCAGETLDLVPIIEPYYATNTDVIWSNSRPSIAEIEETEYGVKVSGKAAGTTVITITTADGHHTATCEVTVDMRERVTVKKDGDYFTVTFADNTVWKGIGCDMSDDNNRSGLVLNDENNYEYLKECERRYLHNKYKKYSAKQFALLYLLDPWGVEFYLTNYGTTFFEAHYPGPYADYDEKLRAYLRFKDQIYSEIYGESPTPFIVSSSGTRIDITGAYDRLKVYTDAELIFGAHNTVDLVDLLEHALDIVIEMFDKILPDTQKNSWIIRGVNVLKTLMFGGSITEAFSDLAVDFIEDYIEDSSDDKIKIMEWPNPLLDAIYSFKSGIDDIFRMSNVNDIKIYGKIKDQRNYKVKFESRSQSLFIDEIIEICS